MEFPYCILFLKSEFSSQLSDLEQLNVTLCQFCLYCFLFNLPIVTPNTPRPKAHAHIPRLNLFRRTQFRGRIKHLIRSWFCTDRYY
jgi:hypothetical protein